MFKTGDVVCLKSGGPLLTISEVNDASVEVQWFSADGLLHTGNLYTEMIAEVVEEPVTSS